MTNTTEDQARQEFVDKIADGVGEVRKTLERMNLSTLETVSVLCALTGAFVARASDPEHMHHDLNVCYRLMAEGADAEMIDAKPQAIN